MQLIEAAFSEGVPRPMRRLRLRRGEPVGVVVARRPDPTRWDVARLSIVKPDDGPLTEASLAQCDDT